MNKPINSMSTEQIEKKINEKKEKVPESFVIFSRSGELTQEERTEIFHTMNDSIEDFLKNYKDDDEEE